MAVNLNDQQMVGLGGSSISPRDTFSMPGIDQGAQRNADALARSLEGFGGALSSYASQATKQKNQEDALNRALYAKDLYDAVKSGEAVDVALGRIAPGQSRLNRIAIQQSAGNLLGQQLAQDMLAQFPQGLADDPQKLDAWYKDYTAKTVEPYRGNIAYAAGINETLNAAFINHRNSQMAVYAKDGHVNQATSFDNHLGDLEKNITPPSTPDQVRRGEVSPSGTIPFNTAGSPHPEQAGLFVTHATALALNPADFAAGFTHWQSTRQATPQASQKNVGFFSPVDGKIDLSSGFGARKAPKAGASTYHKGIDIPRPAGSPVKAAGDGEVVFAGTEKGYGNVVKIRHDDGTVTVYAHLQGFNVKSGQQVSAGTRIGGVGATGVATGNHLHFGMYDAKGNPIDPTRMLGNGRASPTQGAAQPEDVGLQIAEYTNYLKNNGVAPGMGFQQLLELGAPKDKDGKPQLAPQSAQEAYNLLAQTNVALTGSEAPETITASGKPFTGQPPEPGVHADEFPDDIITDPEVRALRTAYMNADQLAQEGTAPQLTNAERREIMFNRSIRIATERMDPKFLAIVPESILTPQQKDILVKTQELVTNLKYQRIQRQRTEDAWNMRSKAIEAMSKGSVANPYELARNPDGTFNYEAWQWIKSAAEEPVSEGQSKSTVAVLEDAISRAAATGNWNEVIKKYPSFAARIRPGQIPDFSDIALAASEVGGINSKDLGGLMNGIRAAYDAGPILQNPAFGRGYETGMGLTVKSWVQNKMNMSMFDTPTIEADVRAAYDAEVERGVAAHRGNLSGAVMNQIIKEANAAARSVYDSITRGTGTPSGRSSEAPKGSNKVAGRTSTGVTYTISQ